MPHLIGRGTVRFVLVAALVIVAGASAYLLRNGWTHAVTSRLPQHPVACPKAARVLVVAGQSMAANAARLRTGTDAAKGFAFDGRDCYPLIDPMAGGDGQAGSIWPLVVDRLPGPTIVVNGAMIGSSILEWNDRPGHRRGYRDRLAGRIEQLTGRGRYRSTLVFMQGETDAGTRMGARRYLGELAALKPRLGEGMPWLIVRETRCFLGDAGWPPLDAARRAFARSRPDVAIGPTIDDLGAGFRIDDRCHLTAAGQREVARRIAAALLRTGA